MVTWFMFPSLFPPHSLSQGIIHTGFYMCHWTRPISILLIFALEWSSTSLIISPLTHVIKQLFFFCVSAPTVLSLDVDSVLCHKSLRIVLAHCIAASRGDHYIWSYHSVSASVYNVLLVLLLSLNQFLEVISVHMEFLQFIISLTTIIFHHHNLFSHSPVEGHTLIFQFFATTTSTAKNIFGQVFFPYALFLIWFCKVFLLTKDILQNV